jgi:predicted  nucleic acid-binding Zn-ribbon protein
MSEAVISPAVIEGDGDLELNVHDNMISQPLAIIGIRWIGKSYMAGKMCEQLCEVKQPFVVIDPEGEFWTLRERYAVIVAAVGKPVGRPKGYKADLIVTPETASTLARRIAEKGYSVVLDSRNATMTDQYAVLGNFLETLYEAEAEYNRPLVVFMEEAHVLIPEIGRVRLPGIKKLQDKVIYWAWEIAARGRHRGLGYVCIARRAAEVAKAVLSQSPTRFIFKLVDPADLAWLRESGFTKEEIDEVQKLPKGVAFVSGLRAEHIKVRSKERLCTHGGKTPIAKAVETPELEHAIADLSKIVKAPLVAPATVPEEALKRIEALETERKQLLGKVQSLESQFSEASAGKESLSLEAERLKARVKELESQVFTAEEKPRLLGKIQALENQVSDLQGRLTETQKIAGEFEEKFERIRQLWGDWAELIVETADILDLELIPKDVKALQEERDRYKAELETYKREDELRKELFQQTLDDANIKSWIRDAEAFLQDLKRRGQAGSAVLKACLRMDPEVTFLPEEIETSYTQSTNATYMKMLEAKGLLWEASKKGRKAFRNRFPYWVAENIRKIRPNAPDRAIDEIVDRLKRSVIEG